MVDTVDDSCVVFVVLELLVRVSCALCDLEILAEAVVLGEADIVRVDDCWADPVRDSAKDLDKEGLGVSENDRFGVEESVGFALAVLVGRPDRVEEADVEAVLTAE